MVTCEKCGKYYYSRHDCVHDYGLHEIEKLREKTNRIEDYWLTKIKSKELFGLVFMLFILLLLILFALGRWHTQVASYAVKLLS